MAVKVEYDHTFKLMLIGDSSVGKTCLMLRFSERDVPRVYAQTIGIDFRVRTVAVDGKVVKLQIWDTAGQERFRTITSACYRGAAGVIFVYDVTSRETFNNITSWVNSFERHITDKVVCRVIVGNKCDLVDQREVLPSEGLELANSLDALFIETSALRNVNVEEMFLALSKRLILTVNKPAGASTASSTSSSASSPLKVAALTLKNSDLQHTKCCH